MAATFLQSLKQRYEVIGGLPVMGEFAWVGVIPEGAAASPPNVCLQHGGQTPTYAKEGIEHVVGEVTFCVYAASLEQAEALSATLQTGMESAPLAVGIDSNVLLFRGRYQVTAVPRGPAGEFMFRAVTPYAATFNV